MALTNFGKGGLTQLLEIRARRLQAVIGPGPAYSADYWARSQHEHFFPEPVEAHTRCTLCDITFEEWANS